MLRSQAWWPQSVHSAPWQAEPQIQSSATWAVDREALAARDE